MILSFKNKNQQENDTDNTIITSRSSSPLNRSDISSNILSLNFEGVKMKLRSANCSLDFSDTSNIKLDNSNFYKDKSQKEDFFNDIINLFNTPKNMNLSHCDSPKDITRDSLILNLDETVCKGKHRKNSLSCSDMNMLIKNFDMDLKTNMKMNANSKKNEQAKAKVHEYLKKGNESGDVNYDLNAENSGKNSLNSSLRKKKENFIPKAELFSINRCEDSQSGNNNFNNKMREMNNKLNPIMNYYTLKLDLDDEKIQDPNRNHSQIMEMNPKKKISNRSIPNHNMTINSNTTEELFTNLNNKIDNLDHTTFSYVTGNNVTSFADNLYNKKIFNQDYGMNERNMNMEREFDSLNLMKQGSSESIKIDFNINNRSDNHNIFVNNLNTFLKNNIPVVNEEDINRKENLWMANYFNQNIYGQDTNFNINNNNAYSAKNLKNIVRQEAEEYNTNNQLKNVKYEKISTAPLLNPFHNNNNNNFALDLNSQNKFTDSDNFNYLNNNKVTTTIFDTNPITPSNFKISSGNTVEPIQVASNIFNTKTGAKSIPSKINKYSMESIFDLNTNSNQNMISPPINITNTAIPPVLPNKDSPSIFNLGKIPKQNVNLNVPLINNSIPFNSSSQINSINHNMMNNNFNNIIPSHITSTNYLEYSDEQIIENAYFFAKDQCLCRHLQKKIIENPQMALKIFNSIKSKMLELINDPFGNYLVQKLIDYIEDSKIGWIIDCVTPTFLEVSSSSHGTRVIQKLIENLKSEILFNKFRIIFTQHLINICKDVNANHIIHKFISTIKSPYNNFVYEIILNQIDEVARDKHGCCVIQKCLESADVVQKESLVKVFIKKTLSYISDQYGNYVLQYLISEDNHEINRQIVQKILPNLIQLSVQKFSSNVIERSFDHTDEEMVTALVYEVANDEDIACKLMVDLYGNYVFQKALSIAKNEYYMQLLKCVAHNVDKLKSVPFGQKLLTKLSNTYKELPIMIKNANNNQMNNKFNNKMKRNSNNKNMHHKNPQAAMPNSNTNFGGVQHNNYYANPINNNIKYRNVNNDMMNTNNIQNFGNNYLGNINNNNTNNYWNSMNNVNSMNSMNLLNNINPQMDNINPSYNNSYANRNPNHHMPPMAVNQYVNQVFYNMGNNNFVPNPTTSQMNIPNIPNNFKNYGKM